MKRRMTLALVLAMSMSAAFAMAEETNSLKDFTSRLKGGTVQTQTAEPETPAAQSEDESSYGKPVKIEDPFFQKVRSSTYLLEDQVFQRSERDDRGQERQRPDALSPRRDCFGAERGGRGR